MRPCPRSLRPACSFFGLLLVLLAATAMPACTSIMPGDSFRGELPTITDRQRLTADGLRADVQVLAGRIGERNVFRPDAYAAAEDFLASSLARAGYRVEWQTFETRYGETTTRCSNLIAEIRGVAFPSEIVVVGAHYDTYRGTPGADDNASGCAALLGLARRFSGSSPERTLRFVFFANEEPPFFWSDQMGSLVYARACKRRSDNITAMLSLETLGFYSTDGEVQHYPLLIGEFYPSTADFVAFVGHQASADLITRCVSVFRGRSSFPCEGAAMPSLVPRIGSSDHWSFWKQGWPSLMVTDTAPYRNRNYHKATDTPETLDYERLARVVDGLEAVVGELAGVTLTNPPTSERGEPASERVGDMPCHLRRLRSVSLTHVLRRSPVRCPHRPPPRRDPGRSPGALSLSVRPRRRTHGGRHSTRFPVVLLPLGKGPR